MHGLQGIHQHLKLMQTPQILEARVSHKKRPASESGAATSLKQFKCHFMPTQQCKNAGNLIVRMVRMSKRLKACARLAQALKCLPLFPRQSVKNAKETDDEWQDALPKVSDLAN